LNILLCSRLSKTPIAVVSQSGNVVKIMPRIKKIGRIPIDSIIAGFEKSIQKNAQA